jgi:conjugal transfer pilus assembly protein TrbC
MAFCTHGEPTQQLRPDSPSIPRDLLGIAPLLVLVLMTSLFAAPEETHAATPQLYVFISASMPTPALREVAQDSVRLRAPLLLRGLVGSSLEETLLNMKDLARLGAALEVDPLLFEAYGIQAVPAVVMTCGGRGEGPFAVTYGAAPSKALPLLRKRLAC